MENKGIRHSFYFSPLPCQIKFWWLNCAANLNLETKPANACVNTREVVFGICSPMNEDRTSSTLQKRKFSKAWRVGNWSDLKVVARGCQSHILGPNMWTKHFIWRLTVCNCSATHSTASADAFLSFIFRWVATEAPSCAKFVWRGASRCSCATHCTFHCARTRAMLASASPSFTTSPLR